MQQTPQVRGFSVYYRYTTPHQSPENLEIVSHSEHSTITNKSRAYKRGIKLNLTPEQIRARAHRAVVMGLSALGRAAIAKATGNPSA